MGRKKASKCSGCDDYDRKEIKGRNQLACKHTDGCKGHSRDRKKEYSK